MKRLKELRSKVGWTQTEVASKLGISQQTYARWESGRSEPNVAKLQAVADLFLTSVDGLVGRGPLPVSSKAKRSRHADGGAFWGHLGIRMVGESDTKWYAVASDEADRARMALLNAEEGEWLAFSTLTNQMVLVRTDRLAQFCLLDDADEAPFGKFAPSTIFGEYAGLPLDAYRMMAAWADGGIEAFESFACDGAEEIRNQVRATIARSEFRDHPEQLATTLRHSTLHFVDGSNVSYRVLGEHLLSLYFLEGEPDARMIEASMEDGSAELIYFSRTLQLLELSLIEIEAAQSET